jgi:hypothetical protein
MPKVCLVNRANDTSQWEGLHGKNTGTQKLINSVSDSSSSTCRIYSYHAHPLKPIEINDHVAKHGWLFTWRTGFMSSPLGEHVQWQYIDACRLSVINPWLCIHNYFYRVGSKQSLLCSWLDKLAKLEASDYHPDKNFTCSELTREQYLSLLAM